MKGIITEYIEIIITIMSLALIFVDDNYSNCNHGIFFTCKATLIMVIDSNGNY